MLGLVRSLPQSSRKAHIVLHSRLPFHQVRRSSNRTIAIDFGYTTSQVAVIESSAPKVIENIEGERSTPTFVAIHKEGNLVGITARRQAITNPKNTFYNMKSVIGQKFTPELVEASKLRYTLKAGDADYAQFADESGKVYSPAVIASFVLQRMKETAENNLGSSVDKAIIGVPAYYGEVENNVIREAAGMIGLQATVTPEPIAAVLAHKQDKQGMKNYFVFDFGGNRLDLSIVNQNNGLLRVTYHTYVTTIGGEVFTSQLAEHVIEMFQDETGIDLRGKEHIQAFQKVSNAAEVAKCELSTSLLNEINLPFIAANESGPKNLIVKVSRAKLEAILLPSVTEAIEPVKKVLEETGLDPKDVELLVVGGQGKMPKIVEELEELFQKKAIRDPTLSPDEAVVLGLHLYVPEATTTTEETEALTKVPLDIGVEVLGGKMEVVIPRGADLPVTAKKIFTTTADNQQEVEIRLYQGNRLFAPSNVQLGQLAFTELPNTLKGELKIEMTINIDGNGTISVEGKELATGIDGDKFVVRSFGGLTAGMVEGLKKEAVLATIEESKSLDTTYREFVETSEQIRKLKMVINGCGNYLSDAEQTDLLRRLEAAQAEIETAKTTPDLTNIRELFAKKMLARLSETL